jgi:hypothetical protein
MAEPQTLTHGLTSGLRSAGIAARECTDALRSGFPKAKLLGLAVKFRTTFV